MVQIRPDPLPFIMHPYNYLTESSFAINLSLSGFDGLRVQW